MATENDVFARRLAPRRRGTPAKVAKIFGLGLLVAAVAAGIYFKFTTAGKSTLSGVSAAITAQRNPGYIFDSVGSDQVNILLIGRDVNWKPGKVYDPRTKTFRPFHVIDKKSPARSDSMIVMTLDKSRNIVRMVSFPRDAIVHLPPNKYHVHQGKLNAAHAYGGPELLIKTLHDELGLTIHRYAVIKFDGFKKLIDEVGGVQVNVEGALKRNAHGKLYRGDLDYDDNWGNLHQHLKPGLQWLNGQQAHDYVRFREDQEGDGGRMRRQQGVMRALAKQIMHLSWTRIPGMVQEVRHQFETDLSDKEIASAAFFAKNLGASQKIQPLTLFGAYNSRGSLTLNRSKNIALLSTVFGRTFDADLFLNNSPSTERDEMGATNNSSPGAKAVLREAGLLGDARARPAHEVTVATITEDPLDATPREAKHAKAKRHHHPAAVGGDETPLVDDGALDGERSSHRRSAPTETPATDAEGTPGDGDDVVLGVEPAAGEKAPAPDTHAGNSDTSAGDAGDASPIPRPE